MRKQIQTAELRIMMQKKMLPVKNRRDREEKSVPPVFFLPVGEMKKCTEKEQKKMKKYYTIKRTFARGLFSNPQKENAFQKFTTENSPTRGAKEQRKEDSS